MGFSKFLARLFPAKAARPKQKKEDEPITVDSKLRGWQIELDSGYALKKAADIIRRDNAKTNSATAP